MRTTSHNKTGALLVAVALNLIAGCSGTSVSGVTSRSPLAKKATAWVGNHYRRGAKRQCANFVGQCMSEAGLKPPPGKAVAQSYWKLGSPVSSPKSGDIVVFKNTYNGSNYITHVGIMVDNTHFVHRPTFRSAVKLTSLSDYRGHIVSYRRLVPNRPTTVPAFLVGPTIKQSASKTRRLADAGTDLPDEWLLVMVEDLMKNQPS